MKRTILTLLIIFGALKVFAQPYGNEWINYSQKYYYFNITQEGVYRIYYDTLLNAGIPVNSIDPRNIQLFGRGQEIPIYIEGENDGAFNTSDFIEFYAKHNDGFLDALVYDTPSSQSNPYYSLYNDTASYYITWNSSINNKRMKLETSINFGSYTKSSYFFNELVNIENSTYQRGETVTAPNTDPMFVATEGWFGASFNFGTSVTKSFITTNIYTGGPSALFKSIITGQSNNSANPDHRITLEYKNNTNTLIKVADTLFEGYKQIKFEIPIAANLLNNSQTDFKFSSDYYQGITANRTAIAYTLLKFPHNFNLENKNSFKLIIPDDPQGKSYLEMSSFSNTGTVRLYDITNGKRITVVSGSGLHRALVPNNGDEKTCYLTSEGQIKTVQLINSVSPSAQFQNYSAANSNYLIITHNSLWESSNAYATYRSSMGYNVLVVDIDELYHQFSYGINKHPISIRRLADFALDTWTTKPEFLFLIGKNIWLETYRKNPIYYAQTLVPSMGVAPCDPLLTAGLNGTLYEMAIPTGRLAAKNNDDVYIYLNKMIEYETETIPTPEWKKNIMHLGGGTSQSEQQVLTGYLNGYKNTIEDTLFGGKVHSFVKSSTDPVQITVSDSIKGLMNKGTSMLTFFAHAAATSFDISLDEPSNYDNIGKYPFLFANACLSGDIHLYHNGSTSEKYVFAPEKGVIGFLATVAEGFPPYLNMYASEIYKNIAYKSYGQPIGIIMKESTKAIQNPNNAYIKDICLQTTLHGDPALKINSQPKPDIMLSQPNTFYYPSDITTDLDSFSVNIILTNLGKSVLDSFNLLTVRILPDGSADTSFFWINKLIYKDTVAVWFRIKTLKESGLNRFNIYADYSSRIDEMSELNNNLTLFFNIKSKDIVPVYPYKFAVVPKQGITLKASTSNPFDIPRNYVFEIDTTDLFNSPLKQRTIINHAGGVVSWDPSLLVNMPDSMVYFWRVSPDSTGNTQYVWRESSFQYIQNKRGWGQAHFFQYKNDEYNLIQYNRTNRKFDFNAAVKQLYCKTGGGGVFNASNSNWIEYKLDATTQDYSGCVGASITVAVIDSISLTPWGNRWVDNNTGIMYNPNNYFGNANDINKCRQNRFDKYFHFKYTEQAAMDGLVDMIKNKVPKGNYLLIYNFGSSNCQSWDAYNPELHNALQTLGSQKLRTLPDSYPFIFLTKVGYPNSTIEIVGDSSTAIITLQSVISNNFPKGDIATELIGPSKKWNSMHWRQSALENPTADNATISIIGVKTNGAEQQLITFPKDSIDVLNLDKYVDASQYPYIRLKGKYEDYLMQTPPQMKRWQVLFDDIPEAALNVAAGFEFYSSTVTEGDSLSLKIAYSNISDIDMDSIILKSWIENSNRDIVPIFYEKQSNLPSDTTIVSSFKFSSIGFGGTNNLWVEINPEDNNWQLEKYHFNNIAQLSLTVEKDKINPLLDVTFDGLHIMDGEIVSAKPTIQIRLSDENKFLALNDTSNFALFIKKPSGGLKQIFFNESGLEIMRFTPAVLPKNSCHIEFSPTFDTDGTYELRVQAKDMSENSSGSYDYLIKFEVINRSTITEVINYPNPFSSSTRFVFTLTGSELPTEFQIQIMTLSGKIVKQITQHELGQLRIGRNITEYAWDGKDEFGDLLGNGLYLYRVITKLNDKDIEKRNTNIDKYFQHGFGKMYLMR